MKRGKALAAWGLLLAAGCAAAPRGRPERPPDAVPELRATAVDGREVSLAALRGRIVLLHFWARWCGACEGDLEIFQDLQERYGDRGVAVVGIAHASGSDPEVLAFADAVGLAFPNVQASDELRAAFGAAVFPTTVVLDRRGAVRYRAHGRLHPGAWDGLLDELLAEGAESGT